MTDMLRKRKFITTATKGAGAAMVLAAIPVASFAEEIMKPKDVFTVEQVLDIILKEVPDFGTRQSVDSTIRKYGPVVTGVVTTMFPTLEVIEKTKKAGANLIIAHETPFYNNND
ncbi:MAG: hypothetical protein WDN26_02345 [Chitinophagaceae bacterium]